MNIEKYFEEFEKGNYTFRYEFTDKDGNRRFQISCINDSVPKNEALKIIGKHISEYEDGILTDFVENNWIKSKFLFSLTRAYEEGKSEGKTGEAFRKGYQQALAERDEEIRKQVKDRKKSLLSDAAYSGGDYPKKYIAFQKCKDLHYDSYNLALDQVLSLLPQSHK